jgi:hypothetical protein
LIREQPDALAGRARGRGGAAGGAPLDDALEIVCLIPEAHRLLRPGGRLIFLCDSVLMRLCSPPSEEPAGETIVRPQFGLYRIDWPDAEGPDFHLPHGEMLRLLRETGFEVEALHELRAPEGPEDEVRFYLRRGWAGRWPGEEVSSAAR